MRKINFLQYSLAVNLLHKRNIIVVTRKIAFTHSQV